MKQTFVSHTAALAGCLLAGQVCHGIPTTLNVNSLAPRDEAAPAPGLFGSSGGPEIDDLAKDGFFGQTIRDGYLDIVTHVMFAFLKCNQAWVETWFPDSGELEKLAETKPLADGEGYFLKYDSADGKRHPVTVSSHWDWADQSLPDLGAPWWPRAALQGAHDGKQVGDLNITEITMAISGEKLVKVELDNKDDYWDIIVEGHRTPVWVVLRQDRKWHVVMSTQGSEPGDGSVNMMKFGSGETKVESPQEFRSLSQMIQEIYHLEGLPSFVNGRKGELQF